MKYLFTEEKCYVVIAESPDEAWDAWHAGCIDESWDGGVTSEGYDEEGQDE